MIKRVLSYAIPADQGGRTVEEFLRGLGYSHRLVVHLKQTPGGILAGGESVFSTYRLHPGQVLTVTLTEEEPSRNIPPADQHRGPGDGCSGDGQKLALALGQVAAVAVQHRVVAVGKAADEGVGVGHLGRGLHVLVRGVQTPVADIVRNGARKQVGVLDDHGEGAAQVVLADVPDVDAVVGDAAAADRSDYEKNCCNGTGGLHGGHVPFRLRGRK